MIQLFLNELIGYFLNIGKVHDHPFFRCAGFGYKVSGYTNFGFISMSMKAFTYRPVV
jgi:hypothetical protein